jgi:hypothetical protein
MRGFFATVAMLSSLLASGQHFNNGVCCDPGTEYDIELGQCMIVNGSPDINGDGCTNLNDLLYLLSGYGTCED